MYHLECQSTKDETMVIRMFEYDISIAIEHASLEENDIWEIEFPQSCVLYIRSHAYSIYAITDRFQNITERL